MKLSERNKLNNITGIYQFINKINNNSYIGQARNIAKRIYEHLRSTYDDRMEDYNYPLHKAIRKYGEDNFELILLERCEVKELNEREIYWITKYDSYRNGYNQTAGGHHVCAQKLPDNIRELLIADIYNNELTLSEIASKYGISLDIVSRINVGKCWKTDNYSYPLRPIEQWVSNHYNGTCVYQLDKNTEELINIFPSMNAAGKAMGGEDHTPHITRCCNGIRNSAYGYKWKLIEISKEEWLKLFETKEN